MSNSRLILEGQAGHLALTVLLLAGV